MNARLIYNLLFVNYCIKGELNNITSIIDEVDKEYKDEKFQMTGFNLACINGRLNVVQYLFDLVNVESQNINGT